MKSAKPTAPASKKDARLGRVKENRELQRRTVLNAAAELFAKKGYAGTSMADVAKVLDISRPALYYYFNTKEEILTFMVQEVTLSLMQLGESLSDRKLDPASTLYELVKSNAMLILSNTVLFKVIERSEEYFPAATAAINTRAKRAIFDKFKVTIQRGIKTRHFGKMNPSVGAFAVLGLCNWSAWWYQPDGAMSDKDVAVQLATMALAAVRNDGAGVAQLEELRPALTCGQAAFDALKAVVAGTSRTK